MKQLASLDAYLPVTLDGEQGLCLALGLDGLLVDSQAPLAPGQELGLRLFLKPGSRAVGRVLVREEIPTAQAPLRRWNLEDAVSYTHQTLPPPPYV